MEQAASRSSFQSQHRPRQRKTSHLSRSRASSISSSSSSASEKDLPNAKYAHATLSKHPSPNALAMPGLPPGVSTGGLGVSVSGGTAKPTYDSVAEEAAPRLKLTSGLYPASHHAKSSSISKPPRSVSDNVSHRLNGTPSLPPHSMRAPSLAPSSTSFQPIPSTSAISPAYNPYQYIPTTSTRQPFSYKPPSRNVSAPKASNMSSSSRPQINRTQSNDSAVSDPNIIDMSSSSRLRSTSHLPATARASTPNTTEKVPSIVLSTTEEEEPPVVRQIKSDYLPSLDNPERHRLASHKSGFGNALGKLEVDMRFAIFKGSRLVSVVNLC